MDRLTEFALTLKLVDREVQRRIHEAMLPLGVTGPQADALVVIGQAGRISVTKLGDLLVAEGGYPTRLVDRLVAAGLVERRPAEDDRRRVELSLTPHGRRVRKRVLQRRAELAELGAQVLDPRDMDTVLDVLRELLPLTPQPELVARRQALGDD